MGDIGGVEFPEEIEDVVSSSIDRMEGSREFCELAWDLALLARAAWALKWMDFVIPWGIVDRVGIVDIKWTKKNYTLQPKSIKSCPQILW
jgi:hypothetical protein